MRAEERLRSHICNIENELEDLRTSLLQGNKPHKEAIEECHKSVQTEGLVALVDASTSPQESPEEFFFLGDSGGIPPVQYTSL